LNSFGCRAWKFDSRWGRSSNSDRSYDSYAAGFSFFRFFIHTTYDSLLLSDVLNLNHPICLHMEYIGWWSGVMV